MQTKTQIEDFVNGWVVQNVRQIPLNASLLHEADRLAARLTHDARAHGISGRDLNRALGDIDEYLTARIQAAGAPPPI